MSVEIANITSEQIWAIQKSKYLNKTLIILDIQSSIIDNWST